MIKKILLILLYIVLNSLWNIDRSSAQVYQFKSYRSLNNSYNHTSKSFRKFFGSGDGFYLYNGPDSTRILDQQNKLLFRYYSKPSYPGVYNHIPPSSGYYKRDYRTIEPVQPVPSFEEAPEIYY